MSFKKFSNNDLFYNTIKTKPHFEFKIQNGQLYTNNLLKISNDILEINQEYILDFSNDENSFNVGII
jgi:hypothetical protein